MPITELEWLRLLASFPVATPTLLASSELGRRTDIKFVLPLAATLEFIRQLRGDYAKLPGGAADGLAQYRTLYFDTENLELFHAHRRGCRVRHKVRLRHYTDRQLSQLEIKTRRGENLTVKTRRPHAYGDNCLSAEDQAFVRSTTGITAVLQPQACTEYRRVTLIGLRHPERVTIDFDLRFGTGNANVARASVGMAVIEIKQARCRRDTPAMRRLRDSGFRPSWSSKYCAAIASTRPEVRRNRLLPGLRRLLPEVA